MAIQLARETEVSAKVMLSVSLVAPSASARMVRLWGDQMAQASTPLDIMAVTTAEGSMSMGVISFMVRPALVRVFTRMVSLEVPEA